MAFAPAGTARLDCRPSAAVQPWTWSLLIKVYRITLNKTVSRVPAGPVRLQLSGTGRVQREVAGQAALAEEGSAEAAAASATNPPSWWTSGWAVPAAACHEAVTWPMTSA